MTRCISAASTLTAPRDDRFSKRTSEIRLRPCCRSARAVMRNRQLCRHHGSPDSSVHCEDHKLALLVDIVAGLNVPRIM
jgi:hypothetical protein